MNATDVGYAVQQHPRPLTWGRIYLPVFRWCLLVCLSMGLGSCVTGHMLGLPKDSQLHNVSLLFGMALWLPNIFYRQHFGTILPWFYNLRPARSSVWPWLPEFENQARQRLPGGVAVYETSLPAPFSGCAMAPNAIFLPARLKDRFSHGELIALCSHEMGHLLEFCQRPSRPRKIVVALYIMLIAAVGFIGGSIVSLVIFGLDQHMLITGITVAAAVAILGIVLVVAERKRTSEEIAPNKQLDADVKALELEISLECLVRMLLKAGFETRQFRPNKTRDFSATAKTELGARIRILARQNGLLFSELETMFASVLEQYTRWTAVGR